MPTYYVRQTIAGNKWRYAVAAPQPTSIPQGGGGYYERMRVGAKNLYRYVKSRNG